MSVRPGEYARETDTHPTAADAICVWTSVFKTFSTYSPRLEIHIYQIKPDRDIQMLISLSHMSPPKLTHVLLPPILLSNLGN